MARLTDASDLGASQLNIRLIYTSWKRLRDETDQVNLSKRTNSQSPLAVEDVKLPNSNFLNQPISVNQFLAYHVPSHATTPRIAPHRCNVRNVGVYFAPQCSCIYPVEHACTHIHLHYPLGDTCSQCAVKSHDIQCSRAENATERYLEERKQIIKIRK